MKLSEFISLNIRREMIFVRFSKFYRSSAIHRFRPAVRTPNRDQESARNVEIHSPQMNILNLSFFGVKFDGNGNFSRSRKIFFME